MLTEVIKVKDAYVGIYGCCDHSSCGCMNATIIKYRSKINNTKQD